MLMHRMATSLSLCRIFLFNPSITPHLFFHCFFSFLSALVYIKHRYLVHRCAHHPHSTLSAYRLSFCGQVDGCKRQSHRKVSQRRKNLHISKLMTVLLFMWNFILGSSVVVFEIIFVYSVHCAAYSRLVAPTPSIAFSTHGSVHSTALCRWEHTAYVRIQYTGYVSNIPNSNDDEYDWVDNLLLSSLNTAHVIWLVFCFSDHRCPRRRCCCCLSFIE